MNFLKLYRKQLSLRDQVLIFYMFVMGNKQPVATILNSIHGNNKIMTWVKESLQIISSGGQVVQIFDSPYFNNTCRRIITICASDEYIFISFKICLFICQHRLANKIKIIRNSLAIMFMYAIILVTSYILYNNYFQPSYVEYKRVLLTLSFYSNLAYSITYYISQPLYGSLLFILLTIIIVFSSTRGETKNVIFFSVLENMLKENMLSQDSIRLAALVAFNIRISTNQPLQNMFASIYMIRRYAHAIDIQNNDTLYQSIKQIKYQIESEQEINQYTFNMLSQMIITIFFIIYLLIILLGMIQLM